MYENYYYVAGCYVLVNQLGLSREAARASEHKRAVRALKLERKAQRQQRRAVRRGREAYTTAV